MICVYDVVTTTVIGCTIRNNTRIMFRVRAFDFVFFFLNFSFRSIEHDRLFLREYFFTQISKIKYTIHIRRQNLMLIRQNHDYLYFWSFCCFFFFNFFFHLFLHTFSVVFLCLHLSNGLVFLLCVQNWISLETNFWFLSYAHIIGVLVRAKSSH